MSCTLGCCWCEVEDCLDDDFFLDDFFLDFLRCLLDESDEDELLLLLLDEDESDEGDLRLLFLDRREDDLCRDEDDFLCLRLLCLS